MSEDQLERLASEEDQGAAGESGGSKAPLGSILGHLTGAANSYLVVLGLMGLAIAGWRAMDGQIKSHIGTAMENHGTEHGALGELKPKMTGLERALEGHEFKADARALKIVEKHTSDSEKLREQMHKVELRVQELFSRAEERQSLLSQASITGTNCPTGFQDDKNLNCSRPGGDG